MFSRSLFRLALLALLAIPAAGCSRRSITAPEATRPPQVTQTPADAITIRATVPSGTPEGDTVFVAGTFQTTAWTAGDPAYALMREPDGRWTITLDLAPGSYEFKFTRGGWDRVEKGPNGEEVPNRTLTVPSSGTQDFTIARWADVGTITGHVELFTYTPFLGGRECWVYLPPDYFTDTARHYPVLYMHDGQNLFDARTSFSGEWRVDEACEELIAAGQIEPIIVVGIENSDARLVEYTPWPDSSTPLPGGGADAFLIAIRDVLKPEIDRHYRTQPDPDHSAMAGSSLGGLLSAYAGYTYSATWHKIAALSSSYWWDHQHMLSYAQSQPKPALTRFYQDMGTIETGSTTDRDMDGIDDYIEDLRGMRDIAIAQGFVSGMDLMSIEFAGHTHSEYYWAQRVPGMLRYLFGTSIVGVP